MNMFEVLLVMSCEACVSSLRMEIQWYRCIFRGAEVQILPGREPGPEQRTYFMTSARSSVVALYHCDYNITATNIIMKVITITTFRLNGSSDMLFMHILIDFLV